MRRVLCVLLALSLLGGVFGNAIRVQAAPVPLPTGCTFRDVLTAQQAKTAQQQYVEAALQSLSYSAAGNAPVFQSSGCKVTLKQWSALLGKTPTQTPSYIKHLHVAYLPKTANNDTSQVVNGTLEPSGYEMHGGWVLADARNRPVVYFHCTNVVRHAESPALVVARAHAGVHVNLKVRCPNGSVVTVYYVHAANAVGTNASASLSESASPTVNCGQQTVVATAPAPVATPAPVALPHMYGHCWVALGIQGFSTPQQIFPMVNGRLATQNGQPVFLVVHPGPPEFRKVPCSLVQAQSVEFLLRVGCPPGERYHLDLDEARRAMQEADRRYQAGEFHPNEPIEVVFNRKVAILTNVGPYGAWQAGMGARNLIPQNYNRVPLVFAARVATPYLRGSIYTRVP